MTALTPFADFGAGLTTKEPSVEPQSAGSRQPDTAGQVERVFTAASTFFSGILAISASQFLGAPLKAIDSKIYEAYMAFTKQSFGVLITTMTHWWSPTIVKVSGDESLPQQLFQRKDGTLECRFPKRLVMMANHQLYTDWLYLWWIAYTNSMHGYIYIILKESLKNIPILGWGAQFYNFIFLSRKWETDETQFRTHLDKLNSFQDPMWLLIFPEGTNLAEGTRAKSKVWADKNGLQDMKHQLLPRSRGLQFALQRLADTTEWLYDCTIGYEGIPPGKFGQDIFTLRGSILEGRPPKSVNMHFRRFKISNIPYDDEKKFDVWLRNRWREKDYLLEHFIRFNSFPNNKDWMIQQANSRNTRSSFLAQPAKCIETQIKSNNSEEFQSIFAPLTSILMLVLMLNGGDDHINFESIMADLSQGKEINFGQAGSFKTNPLRLLESNGKQFSLEDIAKVIPAAEKQDMMRKFLSALNPAATDANSLNTALQQKTLSKPIGYKAPASVKSQPVMPTKLQLASKPSSTVSTPINLHPKRPAYVTKSSSSTPQVPGKSLNNGNEQIIMLAKANGKPKLAAKPGLPSKARSNAKPLPQNLRPQTSKAPATASAGSTSKIAAPQFRKRITIDPSVRTKIESAKRPSHKPGTVTINPAVLAKMRSDKQDTSSSRAKNGTGTLKIK